MFNFLFIFILSIINIISSKLFYIPFTEISGSYYMNLTIGTPYQNQLKAIDQELAITWTDNYFYNPNNSSSSKELSEVTLSFRKINLYGNLYSDIITFINEEYKPIILNDFNFAVIKNTKGYDSRVGGFGFAYKFSDLKYSIIHFLYDKNLISKRAFGIIPNNNLKNNYGKFFFGGLPNQLINNLFKSYCKITNKYNFWSCEMSYVFFGEISEKYENKFYQNNDYSYFNSAEHRILVPIKFMEYLKENYFVEYLKNKSCEYILYGMNFRFECKCDIIKNFEKLTFIFDSFQFTFNYSQLFQEYGGGICNSIIYSNHLRNNNFIFGTPFLKNFYSEFSYDDKIVYFYSNKKFESIEWDKIFPWRKTIRYAFYLIFILFTILSIFYMKNKIKKKKRKGYKIFSEKIYKENESVIELNE